MQQQIISHPGKVVAFDEPRRLGKVHVGKRTLRFCSTSFHSGLPSRFPKVGEPVEVLFADRKLLAVRATTPPPKRFNGKPMAHWEAQAKKLVVDSLVRAALNLDTRALPCEIAHKRLMALAYAEDSKLVEEVLDERERFQLGVANVLGDLAGRKPSDPLRRAAEATRII